ncbi:unnamed protein product [Allacma fusca]|uniref:Uncharacterized protein n=1 Tax=Allacma fusca TaxID=39272 RepID=A0A8J2LPG3_9HEXA|nr:unnamed protein product [Allacma fusca]
MLVICMMIFLLAFTSCMLLIFYELPDTDSYHKHYLRLIIRSYHTPSDDHYAMWFYGIQENHQCCGFYGLDDYDIIANHTNGIRSSYADDLCNSKTLHLPCLEIIMEKIDFIT